MRVLASSLAFELVCSMSAQQSPKPTTDVGARIFQAQEDVYDSLRFGPPLGNFYGPDMTDASSKPSLTRKGDSREHLGNRMRTLPCRASRNPTFLRKVGGFRRNPSPHVQHRLWAEAGKDVHEAKEVYIPCYR